MNSSTLRRPSPPRSSKAKPPLSPSPPPVSDSPFKDTRPKSTATKHPTPTETPLPEDRAGNNAAPFFSRLRARAPGWLVSAVVHQILFIAVALITLSPPKEERLFVVSLPVDQTEQVSILQPVNITPQQVELQQFTPPDVSAPEIGFAIVAPLEAVSGSSALVASEVQDSLGEIRALFGDSRKGMSAVGQGGGAEFFGVKASGKKFAFVVDSSMSMRAGKFEAAKQELSYAVRKLKPNQFFYVIFFDRDAARMTFAPNTEPETRAVRATPKNINLLERWMSTVELEFRTDPYDAVEFAMSLLPDAIYLLTDGKFTDRGLTEEFLAKDNILDDPVDGPRPKVVIHTVGFYQKAGEPTLQQIAKAYGGTYRFVPPPPNFRKLRAIQDVLRMRNREKKR